MCALKQISIPSSVTSIGNAAFSLCTSLAQISISSSVTSTGESAFENCSSLAQISIPSSVTSIGYYAFSRLNKGEIFIYVRLLKKLCKNEKQKIFILSIFFKVNLFC